MLERAREKSRRLTTKRTKLIDRSIPIEEANQSVHTQRLTTQMLQWFVLLMMEITISLVRVHSSVVVLNVPIHHLVMGLVGARESGKLNGTKQAAICVLHRTRVAIAKCKCSTHGSRVDKLDCVVEPPVALH